MGILHNIVYFGKGRDAAVKQLESTAQDFEQMAERLSLINHRTAREQAEIHSLTERAQLLRGQAGIIRELKLL